MIIKTSLKRILLIDKDKDMANNLKDLLYSSGLEVELTNKLLDGLILLKERHFDAIFVDYSLDDISITDFIDNVKIAFPNRIIILLIQRNNLSKLNEFIYFGIDNVLIKPFDFKKLSSLLSSYSF